MSDQANICSSMEIRGELVGDADIVIDGKVNGRISLKGHQLTIGPNGRVEAEIHDASSVKVLGQLIGNIVINGSVEIAAAASMMGDIKAPRVTIEDGAQFRGNIDMVRERSRGATPVAASTQSPPFESKSQV
jgi:cytoskeletal protein CcmA (bactofilin family)